MAAFYSNMSDSRAVVQFVRDIEKYPCLYNQKSLEYANRELKRKTWIQIAKKYKSTVVDCKEKWRKIRIAYMRTLKPIYHYGVRSYSRPYYLANHLKFLLPLKKVDTNDEDNTFIHNTDNSEEIEVSVEPDVCKDDDSVSSNIKVDKDSNSQHEGYPENNYVGEYYSDDSIAKDVLDNKELIVKKISMKNESERNNYNVENTDKRKTCCENIECNPRKMFLLSLLPDVEALNERQMRTFRREVIDLFDRISYE